MYAKDPMHNYIVCHVAHTYSFKGIQGTDWDHMCHELHMDLGIVNVG